MTLSALYAYRSGNLLAANVFIGLNLIGALALGMLIGYERSYQGRAAGMRTYGLVCMSSPALTVIAGFAPHTLYFRPGFRPNLDEIAKVAESRGYRVMRDSVTINFAENQAVRRSAAMAVERSRALSPALLADELSDFEGMTKFSITPVRN